MSFLSSTLIFIEMLFLFFSFHLSPRHTRPRVKATRDDTGSDTIVSSTLVDLSRDTGATLLEQSTPGDGSENIPRRKPWQWEMRIHPPIQQSVSLGGRRKCKLPVGAIRNLYWDSSNVECFGDRIGPKVA